LKKKNLTWGATAKDGDGIEKVRVYREEAYRKVDKKGDIYTLLRLGRDDLWGPSEN